MSFRFIPAYFILLILYSGASLLHAQDVGPSAPITLEHTDSLRGYRDGGEEVNDLMGNVRLRQGVVLITADRVQQYPASNRVILTGNVVVNQPGMSLSAPRAEYSGNSRIASAPNGVTLKEDVATLTAGSGTYRMYERIAHFSGGVTLTDPQGRLTANSGDYYSLERRAVFRGNVHVVSDSGTITAQHLTYWRDTEEAYATGNVVLKPKGRNGTLRGDTLHNIPARSYTIALGRPKLTQIDTVAGDQPGTVRRDTTVITARKMEAFRSGREEYRASDSVRLVRGDLMALANLARFYPADDIIALGGGRGVSPRDTVASDTSRAVTGGPDTSASQGLRSVPPEMYPVVWYDKSQLTGDTITVELEQRKLRRIDVLGNAFAVTRGDFPERFDQLAATRLLFNVFGDTIRSVSSEGMASSIYFMLDGGEPGGVNRTSGDTIRIAFDAGEVSRIRIFGPQTRSEGEYFPERFVAGRETSYRLEGFRWIPRESVMAAGAER